MVAGKSLEWLPPGFTERVKYRNGERTKYYYNDATGTKYYSKKDVLRCATAENCPTGTTQNRTSDGNDKGTASNDKFEARLHTTNDLPKWLPDGWTMEERTRKKGLRKGSMYKVYTDVSGKIFYSEVSVTRYLNSLKDAFAMTPKSETNNVDQSSTKGLATTNIDNSSTELENVVGPSPLVSSQSLSTTKPGRALGKKKRSDPFIPVAIESSPADSLPPGSIKETVTSKSGSRKRKDPRLDTTNDLPKWLLDGWTMEERTRQKGSQKGSMYKVYTDDVSGKIFYSRVAVTRYLNSLKDAFTINTKSETNNVDQSPTKGIAVTNIDNSSMALDNVDEPSPLVSSQGPSTTKPGRALGNRKRSDPFIPVAIEGSTADGLPPGWVKEIVTSKSGSKTRKDPRYTDPVSGYVFRSKPDALRYIKTNDIRYCVNRSKKTESNDLKLLKVKNEIQVAIESSAPDGLPPGWIKEIVTRKSGSKIRKDARYTDPDSGYVFRSKPDALRYINTNDIHYCLRRPIKRMSNDQNRLTTEIQPSNLVQEKLPERPQRSFAGGELNIGREGSDARAPEKSGTKSPPNRTLRRSAAAGAHHRKLKEKITYENSSYEPESEAPQEETEQPQPPPPPELETKKRTSKKHGSNPKPRTRKRKDPILLSRSSKRLAGTERATRRRSSATKEEANTKSPPPEETHPPNGAENPPSDAPPFIPNEPTESIAVETNNNEQESHMCFDFGDSWSDPLEFALKTLRGDISIDETLAAFPGCFKQNLCVPNNSNNTNDSKSAGILGPPSSGSSKEQGGLGPSQANSSAVGDIGPPPGFGGYDDSQAAMAGKRITRQSLNFSQSSQR